MAATEDPVKDRGHGTDDESIESGDSSIDAEAVEELPGTKDQEPDDLDIGEVFELLKNERRRRVIEFLKNQEDHATTLDVLAEHIASLENGVDVVQLSSSQRKRVYIALYQCHLPKMDSYGVVDYDKDRGTIELRDTALLDPYLADGDPDDDEADGETDRTDLAVTVAAAGVALVGATGVGALATLPAALWTVVAVAGLLWVASD